MRKLFRRLQYWIHQRQIEADLEEELEAHRALKQTEFEQSGLPATEAVYASRRALGNVTLAREDARGVWIWPRLDEMFRDLRYGARMLLKTPGFTLIAVFTLALGIGATTAIFTVVNAVLLRPLPYPEADRLLFVGQQFRSGPSGAGEPKFLFWHAESQSFEAMSAYSRYGRAGGNLAGGNEAEFVRGMRVSEEFFRVFGIYPAMGRVFSKVDDTQGSEPVAILSDGLWRRRFGADSGLIGKRVLLDDRSLSIIGVMPPQFPFGLGADLFVPMQARPDAHFDPNAEVVGRLKPGVTPGQALAELKVVAEKYRAAFPRRMADGESIYVQPYQDLLTSGVARWLWILLGAVGFLLLIACANVANLQLTRSAARQ